MMLASNRISNGYRCVLLATGYKSVQYYMGHFVAYLNIQYKLVLNGHSSVQFSSLHFSRSVVSDSL